jgi:NADH-quinone oxidoreductase subunit F
MVCQDRQSCESGTKVFSLVRKVKNTGLVELPLGEKLTTLSMSRRRVGQRKQENQGRAKWRPMGGCIPARLFGSSIDYESLVLWEPSGIGGNGRLDSDNCMVDSAR